MKRIIYYVASSLDGFIAGENDDISQFILEGDGVDKYRSDLGDFGTIIMGRKTYEFGYQYGLRPGQPAYPNMQHHIFSNSFHIERLSDMVKIEKLEVDRIKEIRSTAKTDIYLCGGGQFAGWLLDNDFIDELKLKLNPVVLGRGTRLFGTSSTIRNWELSEQESFSDGLQILTYRKKG